MAGRLFALIFFLCCLTTNALAIRNKGVPLEYASVQFVREKVDTLQLEIRTTQGKLDSVRLTGNNIHFQANDSTIQIFWQFMLHGFEIGTKPKENGGEIYIHLLAPTNYEGIAMAIDDKGEATIEKVLSAFARKKGESVKRKDYKPKRIYSKNDDLQMVSMHLVYDLGVALGKMEIWMGSNNLLKVNAFNRADKIGIKEKSESITSIFMYEMKQNALYLLKLPEENVRLPVQWQ